jgi:hypothetical protein
VIIVVANAVGDLPPTLVLNGCKPSLLFMPLSMMLLDC